MNSALPAEVDPFGPPPPDVRFLYDASKTENSAVLQLGWCVGEAARKYLKTYAEVDETFLLVRVVAPSGREERYLFELLTDFRGLIEFHEPGVHKISGKIACGYKRKRMEQFLLSKVARHEYAHSFDYLSSSKHLKGTELEVEVPKGDYFVKEPSPQMEWWINLWFREPWWDYCQLFWRKVLAFTVQPPVVALYIVLQALLRFSIAFLHGFLLAERGISWAPIIHPFIYNRKAVRRQGERWRYENHWGSFFTYNKNGSSRGFPGVLMWFFMPMFHLVMFLIASFVWVLGAPKQMAPLFTILEGGAWYYLLALGTIATVAACIGAIIGIAYLLVIAIGWVGAQIDAQYPAGTHERTRFFKRVRWATVAAVIAIGYFLTRGYHVEDTAATIPAWLKTIEHFTAVTLTWVLPIILISIGYWYLPEPKKKVITSTLRDGFRAIATDLTDGVQYLKDQSRERKERALKREREQAELLYDQLACEQAPATGMGLRIASPKPVAIPTVKRIRLAIQDHKADNCRPRARL